MSSDLLSTDARCLVIILGEQCNMVFFLPRDAMLSAVHAVVVCLSFRLFVGMCLSHSGIVHDRPGTLVFKWDVL